MRTTSSGLKDRMKAFENNKNSNLVRRETVTAGERASDIKSRISGWGRHADADDKVPNVEAIRICR